MMTADGNRPDAVLYFESVAWSVASILIGVTVGLGLVILIQDVVGDTMHVGGRRHITENFLLLPIILPLVGVLTGMLQYLLLRRHLQRMGWWIAATALGWPLAFLGGSLTQRALSYAHDANSVGRVVLTVLFVGGSFGVLQWLLLRQRVRHSGWWIVAHMLAWGMVQMATGGNLSTVLDVLAFSTIPALVTGVALWMLLDRLPRCEAGKWAEGSEDTHVGQGSDSQR